MILSRYCKIYPSGKTARNRLLYSTKNAAIAEIPGTVADNISSHRLSNNDRTILQKMGFLIKDPFKEKEETLKFVDDLNGLNKTLNIKLVMNLACNLACKYCFEGTRKGNYYMTKQTADDFIGFIKKTVRSKRDFKDILITFYGGEPLLSRELIIYISQRIKTFSEKQDIRFRTYFVTNGTLLTKETVKMLKPLGLKEAQITIDGPSHIHNRFRPYRTGAGSFEAIMRNVKDVRGMIKICLSGNYSSKHYRDFPKLLSYLLRNGLGPGKIKSVQFSPISAESEDFGPPDFNDGCVSDNEPWLFEASLYLREKILKSGFRLPATMPGLCMMEYRNNYLVNYDGGIYKCPGMIGRDAFKIGDINAGIEDYRKSHNLDNWKNEECLACEYLPLCFGGCRYMKFVRDGNMDGVDCKKPYYDACLETLVKQDIKYGLVAQ